MIECLDCYHCKRKDKKTYCKENLWIPDSRIGESFKMLPASDEEIKKNLEVLLGEDFECDKFQSMVD